MFDCTCPLTHWVATTIHLIHWGFWLRCTLRWTQSSSGNGSGHLSSSAPNKTRPWQQHLSSELIIWLELFDDSEEDHCSHSSNYIGRSRRSAQWIVCLPFADNHRECRFLYADIMLKRCNCWSIVSLDTFPVIHTHYAHNCPLNWLSIDQHLIFVAALLFLKIHVILNIFSFFIFYLIIKNKYLNFTECLVHSISFRKIILWKDSKPGKMSVTTTVL